MKILLHMVTNRHTRFYTKPKQNHFLKIRSMKILLHMVTNQHIQCTQKLYHFIKNRQY